MDVLGVLTLSLVLVMSGLAAGFMGALTGLGGATFLIPIYVLFVGMPIQYAAGVSLISTVATSSGSASAYIRDRVSNVRIGMSLLTATTSGSIVGALLASWVYSHGLEHVIYIVFGVVLLGSIYTQVARARYELPDPKPPDRWTTWLRLSGSYYDPVLGREVQYHGVRWWLGALIMFAAGVISGLLGIGSGALKVLAMDWAMNLPIKVSTTTSNFMIGVTAATGSAIYWHLGYIQPYFAGLTAVGVLAGSYIGTKALMKLRSATIRYIFIAVLAVLGVQMLLKGLGLYPGAT
ncbi:putative permease K07090 [Pyrobaculum ferrireducens]|uniref:Probable membrane transporter protein n=1 Tax=Pyrobaculum ferrireducens TaxID=1104324 RepID=G7VG77_9CREN|nr:putative permease K07090 [Pyrobaculum ferrireducens]